RSWRRPSGAPSRPPARRRARRTRAPSAPRARSGRGCARRRASPCEASYEPTWPRRALRVSPRRSSSDAPLDLRLAVAGVPAEGARRRELAELVPDHLLRDEDRHVLAAVVDRDRVADHLREDRRGSRPGADHPLLVRRVQRLDAAHQPFLHERPLLGASAQRFSLPLRRPRTISLSDSLCLPRVRLPSVGTPHGVTGWRPPFDLPSPPPCGWSTGFIAEPRTDGRLPSQRLRPALPMVTFWWSALPTCPIVARQTSGTRRSSPEGRRSTAYGSSLATSWMPEPALRASWPPRPGFSSTLWTSVPVGMLASGSLLSGRVSAPVPA